MCSCRLVSVNIYFTDLNRYSPEHILLTDMNIICVSYELPVSGDADRGRGFQIHIGTDTCQIHTECHGFRIWMVNACINTHMHGYGQIWTGINIFWNLYPERRKIFTAQSVQWLGLSHRPGRSWDRSRVWIMQFWGFWGAYRHAFSENDFFLKN